MAGEGIQNYVDLAAGLTKATRAKATAAVKGLLATAGLEEVAADATDRVTKLTDEVLAASRANRELMGKLIASEVDRAAAALGFVRAEELEDLRRELSELRMGMAHAAAQTDDSVAPDPARKVAARKMAAKKMEARKVAAKTAAERSTAKKSPASSPPAKSAPAKQATAKKAAAKHAPAKKAAAEKAPSPDREGDL